MSATAQTLRPPSRTLMFLEGRAIHEFGAFVGALPLLSLAPRGDGHPVLVLPGLDCLRRLDAAAAQLPQQQGLCGAAAGSRAAISACVRACRMRMVDLRRGDERHAWPQDLRWSAGASAASMRASSPR